MVTWKTALAGLVTLLAIAIAVAWYFLNVAELDRYVPLYSSECASCHEQDLRGGAHAPALVGVPLQGGSSVDELQASIRQRHLAGADTSFNQRLSDVEIKGLAIYVGERRMGQRFTDFKYERDIEIPESVLTSERHRFRLERVADGLDPLVFSIEPLPGGELLVTEKERGLTVISANGERSAPILGTPVTGSSIDFKGIQFGSGWLLDVALHPNYEDNGWVYLHHTHLLGDDCDGAYTCPSMNRLVRGRIEQGEWVDQEVIWSAPEELYSITPDTGAGGRIAFDEADHVYVSMGIKSSDGLQDTSAQDLASPYGKVHRVRTNGAIPADNPFANLAADDQRTIHASIWTYGHRSPQGLEWHSERQRVWNSEMGPRGGDELNELLPGRNYSWPFHSRGLEYAGSEVERHKPKGIEFDASEVQHTLVDITPSPAISSFVVYEGTAFQEWTHDILIGSLKGSSLFRMRFDGDKLVHRETLISDLARIRDVEVDRDGLVYLLLESKSGSSIVRLVPETA